MDELYEADGCEEEEEEGYLEEQSELATSEFVATAGRQAVPACSKTHCVQVSQEDILTHMTPPPGRPVHVVHWPQIRNRKSKNRVLFNRFLF